MTVGERIKQMRINKGYSVRYLSDLSGISRSTISRWENRHLNPSEENLRKIITALGTTPSQFWSEPLGYVETQADMNKGIKEQIDRICRNLGDIQIAMNILREHYGIKTNIVQKLGTEDTIVFTQGIDKAAKALKRTAGEKDNYFPPLTRKEFRYDWCTFTQYPKPENTRTYE